MAIELFDRVDQKDNVIGTTHKQEAHTEGYIHRVVAVYAFDKKGQLYVQHHKKANMYDHSVGGHVAQGESYDIAAAREASEELGITDPVEFVASFYSDETYSGANYRHMFALYICTPSDSWEFIANDEVGKIEPMPLSKIINQMNEKPQSFTPGFLNSMEFYLRHIGSDLKLDLSSVRQNGY
jgi:isopentenyldiphosphate isomerase